MKRFLLIVGFALVAPLSLAQPSPVRQLSGIEEYSLPNGLQILLAPDDERPSASVNITYRVGSRHESAGQTGSAHLLEHMLFKPSGTVQDAKKEMQALGMRWNGTTSADRTNYFASFSTADAEAPRRFDFMIRWLSGMMTQARFTADDLKSEMTVVRNEWERAENEPGRVLGDRMRTAAYGFHGYRHSTLGARSDIENITVQQLYAFYRQHYRPDNATLIVSGAFDKGVILRSIEAAFGPIARPAEPLPVTYTAEPSQDGERSVTLRRAGGLGSVMVLYHMPAGNTREGVAGRLLAGSLTQDDGPLSRALTDTKIAATEWAFFRPSREPGFLMAGAGLNDRTAQMNDAAFEAYALSTAAALARVVETTVLSDGEIERTRNAELQAWRGLRRDSESTAQALSEMVALGDWRFIAAIPQTLADIQPDEVRQLARAYLLPSNRTTGLFIPASTEAGSATTTVATAAISTPSTPSTPVTTPSTASMKLQRAPAPRIPSATDFIAPRADSMSAEALKGLENSASSSPANTASFPNFAITPAALKERTQRTRLAVGGQDGLHIAVLPRASRDDRVVGTLRLRWGSVESLKGSSVLGSMAGSLLNEGIAENQALGIAALGGTAMRDRLQALDARVSFGSFAGGASASFEFPADKTQEVMALVASALRSPAFTLEAFERDQRATIAALQNQRANPAGLAGNAMQRWVRPPERYAAGDIRAARSLDEVEKLMREATAVQLREHWQRFAGASHGELVLVGPVMLAAVQAPLQRLWGDWATRERLVENAEPSTPVAASPTLVIRVPDKANASYQARIGVDMNDDDADYPALFAATQLLSRQILWERVREREGLSYGIDASLSTPSVGRDASINIGASFAPSNRERLQTVIRAALQEARAKGFSEAEVKDAKRAIQSHRAESLSQPANAASNIANRLRFGQPLDLSATFSAKYEALDAATVNAALRKYLDIDALREVVAGSFE
jgi:zinc protease